MPGQGFAEVNDGRSAKEGHLRVLGSLSCMGGSESDAGARHAHANEAVLAGKPPYLPLSFQFKRISPRKCGRCQKFAFNGVTLARGVLADIYIPLSNRASLVRT